MDQEKLTASLQNACSWITDIAQVKSPEQADTNKGRLMRYANWDGAIRGEYRAATRAWDFYCPVWHTGQAVKALVMASKVLGDALLEGAVRGAEFILNTQISSGKDKGLILAYEGHPDKVNTSAILECLDGLFCLADVTGKTKYRDAALDALTWVAEHAYRKEEGLFNDLYDPATGNFVPNAYKCDGRPLLDDAVFLTGYHLTGQKTFRAVALETAERLWRDENPAGNWVGYPPCNEKAGQIHPRHAYWWGYPMLAVYEETQDERFLNCFHRSVQWYRSALRWDGGLFRGTYTDFRTDSFGHAVSGVGCAVSMFLAKHKRDKDETIVNDIKRGLAFCQNVQFTQPADSNLKGAILEKVLPPDGTDASPYHIRDLGTIFFVQAASFALSSGLFSSETSRAAAPIKQANGLEKPIRIDAEKIRQVL